MSLSSVLESIFGDDYMQNALGAGLGAGMLVKAYDDIGDAGNTGRQMGDALAQLQLQQTQFQSKLIFTT